MKQLPFDKITTKAPIAFLMKYIKGSPTLCGIEFEGILDLPYQFVKHTLPQLFTEYKYDQGLYEFIVASGKKCTFRRVRKARPEEKLAFIKWLQEQYKALEELERQHLYRPPKAKLVRAGIKKLNVLGDFNLIDILAKEDIEAHERVRQLPYSLLFDKQLRMVLMGDVNDELERIRKEESKIKKK